MHDGVLQLSLVGREITMQVKSESLEEMVDGFYERLNPQRAGKKTQADKEIIVNNSKGVHSKYYEPGPFSSMEAMERIYIDWILQELHSVVPSWIVGDRKAEINPHPARRLLR